MGLDILTAKEIKNAFPYRWPRLCLDQRFWESKKTVAFDPSSAWLEVKFERANYNALDTLDGQQGVYAFVAKPRNQSISHHSYVLYVGETQNMSQRFKKYFSYVRSTHPSDQKRRRMVIVWDECLYFNYVLTPGWAAETRKSFEYDLIDTIAPPINDEFRSRILANYRKALDF